MSLKIVMSYSFIVCILLMALPSAAEHNAPADKDCPNICGFMVVGEIEHVTIKSKNLRLKARIDTGATTSSLNAQELQPFERDGKKWIKFSVTDPVSEKFYDFERPVVRIAEIKRHGAAAQERPVVKLKIMLGDVEMEREFSLTDRSRYTFPVLIGRNVLSGKFLVDVNRKFTTKHTGGKEE
jgi:hypothetical protein